MNELLGRHFHDRPDAVACHAGGRAVSCARLARTVEETAAALALAGVRHGMRTALLVHPGVELVALALALLRLGAVPVLVDPGMPVAAVRRCLERAAPEAFIGVPLAQAARLALGWARRSSRVIVTVGPRRLWPGPTLAGLRAAARRRPPGHPAGRPATGDTALTARTSGPTGSPSRTPPAADLACTSGPTGPPPHTPATDDLTLITSTSEPTGPPAAADLALIASTSEPTGPPAAGDLALIACTSGSTGPPKGVPLRHRHLTAQLDLLDGLRLVRPGTATLSTFLPFALAATAMGASAVLPDVDPRRPIRADCAALAGDILRHRVATVFAAPALLDRLARHCVARGVVLDPVETVAVAGAPLPLPTLERVRRCLPRAARVLSVYGATECLPVAAIEGTDLRAAAAEHPGAGTCLGRPVAGVEVRVIGVTDHAISRWDDELLVPTGTVGEIVVTSPALGDPYLDDPRATSLARIADGSRVRHRMGDLGHLDSDGRLWFAGRKSERVRTPGGDLCTEHVEPLFAALPGVRRTALVGVFEKGGPPGAQRPVLVVEREPGARRSDVRAAVLEHAARHPHTSGIREVLFHPAFPMDARHNSKICRHVLAAWAASPLRAGRR
ncbi:AMP-binding protein [[Actinomadura] parvosata]|uniref:AMP-binding protein n=1 Tax=[Actinomadura] parvosata TaxID=1955412 RepID=UPI001645DBD5|nr:AMP-binding protein [Nonomuraea sp. ATCC 55076]